MPRGRPRKFNVDHVLNIGEELFHENGYDYVSISEITEICKITPTSFYSAFSSKNYFFECIMKRYSEKNLSIKSFISSGKKTYEVLVDILLKAVHVYTKDQRKKGCLVLEALHLSKKSDILSSATHVITEQRKDLSTFIQARGNHHAEQVVDFVFCTLAGLSSCAREGWSAKRLEKIVENVSHTLREMVK